MLASALTRLPLGLPIGLAGLGAPGIG